MKHEYQKELRQIRADDAFKQQLKRSMRQQAAAPNSKQGHGRMALALGAIAVILAIALYALIQSNLAPTAEITIAENLPILILHEDEFMIGGLGGVGSSVEENKDAAQIFDHHTPYTADMQDELFPVYENINRTEIGEQRPAYSEQEAKALLRAYGELLQIDDGEITTNAWGEPCLIGALGTLTLNGKDSVMLILSDTYKQAHPLALNTDSQAQLMEQVAQIIKQEPALFPFEQPWIDVMYTDLSIQKVKQWQIQVSESGTSKMESLLNHQLKQAILYADETGCLSTILFPTYDITRKIGDYPIKSYAEAKEDLLQGRSFHFQMEGDLEQIVYTEIVYHKGYSATYYLPYYRFIVKAKNQTFILNNEGNTVFVDYYVPAVSDAYLVMP